MSDKFSYENLYRHYLACRKTKRNTYNALRFEVNQERELLALQTALIDRTYQPKPSVCFITKRPKLREIFAADFRDRVVHHVLVDYLESIWEPIFIHDSYACRKGKGVHGGVKRLQKFIRQVTSNGQCRAWYLQLDIRNYFMRIDQSVLWEKLAPKIKNDDMRWLAKLLVFHDCAKDFIFRGDPYELKKVPEHKSLITAPTNKGLPIGNLNSQFFANVYLNTLDQFVKHTLTCKYYLRYCDDFVLLANNPDQLMQWKLQIADFLERELLLELNPTRERLRPVSDGVDFLGYIVRKDYLLVRRRVVNHLILKLKAFEEELVKVEGSVIYFYFDEQQLNKLHAMLSSYLGHFKLANAYKLWRKIWTRFGFLNQYFSYDDTNRKLLRKYLVPKQFRTVRQQYAYFRWLFPDDVLFFQVGKYFEFYCHLNGLLLKLMGLSLIEKSNRGVRYGFPVWQQKEKMDVLIKSGFSIVIISQVEKYISKVHVRLPKLRIMSASNVVS